MKSQTIIAPQKIYSRDEALKAALHYFKGDELAASVWLNKYALKDSADNIYESTPNEMHQRIASEIARVEQKYTNPLTESEIFEVISQSDYQGWCGAEYRPSKTTTATLGWMARYQDQQG